MGSGPTIPDPHVKIETCPTSSDVILRSCGTHTHNNVMRLKMHEDWAGPPTQKTHLRVINTYGACARGGGRRPPGIYEATACWTSPLLHADLPHKICALTQKAVKGVFTVRAMH